ncbi:MAG: hypothetical protein M1816_002780 [Peltula sp. TS41687]|nr:MAG: hypothetical protein M1816_002780 [Peltula sp. TS41687]
MSTETLYSEDEYLNGLELEREWYHEFINDGDRPWYNSIFLRMLLGDQKVTTYDDDWKVFGKQLKRWKEFRACQASTRGGADKFRAYIMALKSRLARHGFTQKYQLDNDLN